MVACDHNQCESERILNINAKHSDRFVATLDGLDHHHHNTNTNKLMRGLVMENLVTYTGERTKKAQKFLKSLKEDFGRKAADRVARQHVEIKPFYKGKPLKHVLAIDPDYLYAKCQGSSIVDVEWDTTHTNEVESDWGAQLLVVADEKGDPKPQKIYDIDESTADVFWESGEIRYVSYPNGDLSDPEVQSQILFELQEDITNLDPKEALSVILKSPMSDKDKLKQVEKVKNSMN